MKRSQKYRLLNIGPGGATAFGVGVALPLSTLAFALGLVNEAKDAVLFGASIAVSFTAGAWLFNFTSPMFGGMPVWLAEPERETATAPSTRTCPECGAEGPSAQSLCAQCDHNFDGLTSSPAP